MSREKKFLLVDTKNNDILGGSVGVDNVYLTTHAEYMDDTRPVDLLMNEKLPADFNVKGAVGVYLIKRVL